jgi:hypothetical protein
MFREKMGTTRRAYRPFVEKGIAHGRRQDLTGGGLLRSAGSMGRSEGCRGLRIVSLGRDFRSAALEAGKARYRMSDVRYTKA